MTDIGELFGHVRDGTSFHFPLGLHLALPQVFGLQLTKFMVLELLAAALMMAIFIPLGRKMAAGGPPRGLLWNMFETVLVFLRDEVVRPSIGHEGDRFLPFVWHIFFFVLFCNLVGILPWAGSPTGALSVTAVLALSTFVMVVAAGMRQNGIVRFWWNLAPHMDVPLVMAIFLKPLLLFIEFAGLLIKHCVLAVRLLANMFAGHLVLAVFLSFIAATAGYYVWWLVAPASVLVAVALNLLELLVAFLQAYIFAFLAALFIGMAVHQH
ncbi:MAG: F0F1 ATP synthase subunit A [Thermoguttaceae bacterium]|jgi:F-type H+-transporting ATPase subunit a